MMANDGKHTVLRGRKAGGNKRCLGANVTKCNTVILSNVTMCLVIVVESRRNLKLQ